MSTKEMYKAAEVSELMCYGGVIWPEWISTYGYCYHYYLLDEHQWEDTVE